jgi:ABC-type bacteriocin/lantibiotic exporter with double-glycine peptidase domain
MMFRKFQIAVLPIAAAFCSSAALAAGVYNLWLDVPFVSQTKDGCGAASIAMVMQYWERQQGRPTQTEANPAEILHALYSEAAHGIYASAMARYLEANGFRAFAFAADWMDIERQLHFGRPLIVALKPDSGPSLHYVVVAGLDEPQQLVLINDPAQRKLLKEDQSQFEREWKAAGNWALLAVPQSGTPQTSVPPSNEH